MECPNCGEPLLRVRAHLNKEGLSLRSDGRCYDGDVPDDFCLGVGPQGLCFHVCPQCTALYDADGREPDFSQFSFPEED